MRPEYLKVAKHENIATATADRNYYFLISSASVSKERKQNIERKIEKLKEETHKDACYETFFVDTGALLLDFIQFLYVGSNKCYDNLSTKLLLCDFPDS